jgi:hypothetical protein
MRTVVGSVSGWKEGTGEGKGGECTLSLGMAHGYAVRVTSGTAGDTDEFAYSLGVEDRRGQTLHTAHAGTDRGIQFLNAHPIQKTELRAYHILHGKDREASSVRLITSQRVLGTRSSTAITTSQHIGANDKVLVRIDRSTRSDKLLPPARLGVCRSALCMTASTQSCM